MKAKLPTIRELAELVRHVAKQVPRANDPDADDYREDQDSLPSINLTKDMMARGGEISESLAQRATL